MLGMGSEAFVDRVRGSGNLAPPSGVGTQPQIGQLTAGRLGPANDHGRLSKYANTSAVV